MRRPIMETTIGMMGRDAAGQITRLDDSLHDLEKQVHRYQYKMLGLDCMLPLHTFRCLHSGHTLLLRKHYFHIHNYSYLFNITANSLRIPWKSIVSCEKKENSAASFPSKFCFPTNKRTNERTNGLFFQSDSISIDSETAFACCGASSIGAGGLGVVL